MVEQETTAERDEAVIEEVIERANTTLDDTIFFKLQRHRNSVQTPLNIQITADVINNLSFAEIKSMEIEEILTRGGTSKHGREEAIKWANQLLEVLGVGMFGEIHIV